MALYSVTSVLVRGRFGHTEKGHHVKGKTQREQYVPKEAEIGALHLQAKEGQEFPATTKKLALETL